MSVTLKSFAHLATNTCVCVLAISCVLFGQLFALCNKKKETHTQTMSHCRLPVDVYVAARTVGDCDASSSSASASTSTPTSTSTPAASAALWLVIGAQFGKREHFIFKRFKNIKHYRIWRLSHSAKVALTNRQNRKLLRNNTKIAKQIEPIVNTLKEN